MRIASLDIGTNTVLLLIVEVEGESFRVVCDNHAIARLGEGVDRTRNISEEAYQRFREVLQKHAETIGSSHVDRVAAVGTSALRDAENRDEILRRAKADTGIEIEIISGDEEARWTYRGALLGMTVAPGTVGVVDIGGGSTEISSGDGHEFVRGVSIDIGAVRITERCFATSPITTEAAAAATALVQNSIGSSQSEPVAYSELVAVAGTPTTLAAMDQGLAAFDKEKVQGYELHRSAVDRLLDIMMKVDTQTLLARFPSVNKARADILPAGTLILREVMDYCGVDSVRVSTQGLRYGIAIREAGRVTL
jgi:exopolyphosphatase/guanosine-5'-triphosphate,3'-diphosphate pyrophosphatase